MYIKAAFWGLVLSSLVMPVGIYVYMIRKTRISRWAVLGFGLLLILLSGIDTMLLQQMMAIAKTTPSLIDDVVFLSESSIALYLLPLVAAAVGTNLISQVLVDHLSAAERLHDQLSAAATAGNEIDVSDGAQATSAAPRASRMRARARS